MASLTFILLVALLVCILAHESAAAFPRRRKANCAVSVWSNWSSWSAAAPGGTRERSRTILRNPRNGGKACPLLKQKLSRTDPWDRNGVVTKFNKVIVTGVRRPGIAFKKVGGVSDDLTHLPRDLLFVIDMSGSISTGDWNIMRVKVAALIGKLCGTIGRERDNNRIAIVTFSSRVVLNFNYMTHWTLASVRKAILGMPQDRGLTCTGDAFNYATKYMFEPGSGMRSATESVKEVLVLTDGHSNCGANLTIAIKRLKLRGFVSALAIGEYSATGRAEIESMVSNPKIDHIFSLAYFYKFGEMVDAVLKLPDPCALFVQ